MPTESVRSNTAVPASTKTLEQLVSKHWQRWLHARRVEWDHPLHVAAARLGIDAAQLEEVLDAANIRARWNKHEARDHLTKRIALTLELLKDLLPEQATLDHRTVILPDWDGWHVRSNLDTLVAILEHALHRKILQAGYGVTRPSDQQTAFFINFGSATPSSPPASSVS
jgi:hypothetical protein